MGKYPSLVWILQIVLPTHFQWPFPCSSSFLSHMCRLELGDPWINSRVFYCWFCLFAYLFVCFWQWQITKESISKVQAQFMPLLILHMLKSCWPKQTTWPFKGWVRGHYKVTWQNPWVQEGWRVRAINALNYHIHCTHGRKISRENDIASPNHIKHSEKNTVILTLGSLLLSLSQNCWYSWCRHSWGKTATLTDCFLLGNQDYLSFCVSSVFRTKYRSSSNYDRVVSNKFIINWK